MYTLSDHGKMVADTLRLAAYNRAIQQSVKPGDTVVDIGSGAGIFALLAVKYGAVRIYAIEPGEVIQVARENAAANGYDDRIEFIKKPAKQVSLSRRADVIISDLRGVLPLFGQHIPSIIHAREQLLAPDGVLIPKRDDLWAAIVTAPELYRRITQPWCSAPLGLDMQTARDYLTHTWIRGRVLPQQMVTEPYCWASLDYSTVAAPNVSEKLKWAVTQTAVAHGMIVWFNSVLTEGVSFSNAPGQPELIYSQAFFPWLDPIALAADDTVEVTFSANLIGEDYIWRWNTLIFDRDRPEKAKAQFRQSTFHSVPLAPAELHKQATSHQPALNMDGRIVQDILNQMDGRTSLENIAGRIAEKFPEHFTSTRDALYRVQDLSKKYSR